MNTWASPGRGYDTGRQFRDVVAASQGDATHAILIVLVAAIQIALDNGNGGDEAMVEPTY